MSATNSINLIGRLVRDPELRTTSTGKSVLAIGIAVDRPHQKDKTDFFDLVLWGPQAEYVTKYAVKGTLISVGGILTSRNWTANDGSKRKAIEVLADDVKILSKKEGNTTAAPAEQSSNSEAETEEPVDEFEEELPF